MASQEGLAEFPNAADFLPTHLAAGNNNVSELSRLVGEGAELVDHRSKETPLHAAAKSGSLAALKWLVGKGVVPLEAKSARDGYTAAHFASVWGHFQCLKDLLTHDPVKGKALSEMGDNSGLTVVSLAALQGDKEMVLWILEQFPSTVHIPNNNGDQVVHFAAAEGHLDILKMLVERYGREIVSREDNKLAKPVFFAAQQGKINILEYLITELGEDLLAKDDMGMCTIHAATQNKMLEAVKWLINKLGPQHVLNKTTDGATPLHLAAASGNADILKFLLDNLEDPGDINVKDHIHATPAYDAAEFGQCSTMIVLLQHGADVTIADIDNKTPYEIALEKGEKGNMKVAAMLAEYQEKGPSILQAHEKRILYAQRQKQQQLSTSAQQEAEELSSVIQKTSDILHRKKEEKLRRQESLNVSNRIREDEDDEVEDLRKMGCKHMGSLQEEGIAHTLGPEGDFYAVPQRKAHGRVRRARGVQSQHSSDVEEYMSETMLHHPYGKHCSQTQHMRGSSIGNDPTYATVNYDTSSSYGRPSRIKHYQDSDSEISGLTGRSDHVYEGRPQGFYPPGYNPGYLPTLPMPRHPKNRAASASSRGSSFSGSQGHYGIPAAPMYIGYPQMYHGYPQAGGFIPVPQQQMMQGYGPLGGMSMYVARPMHMHKYHQAQSETGRTKSLRAKKTKKVKKAPSADGRSSSRRTSHTDQDMGYGPALDSIDAGQLMATGYDDNLHPPAPPINSSKMADDTSEVLKFDSNFIMTRPGDSVAVRHLGETALNPAKDRPAPYDGRYDQYIMTDSEDEYEVDDHHRVGYAAEVACIIAIGCVAGLKGLAMKKKEKKSQNRKPSAEKSSISTAWDMSYHAAKPTKKGGRKSKRNSVSEVDSPALQGLSPDEYLGREEAERTTWDKEGKKKKNRSEEKKWPAEAEEIQSELLTQDLIMSYKSVSKSLGEKILGETIGARNTSMVNMIPSSVGSRMSLASNTDEDYDNNFDDAISILQGKIPSKRKIAIDDGDEEEKELLPSYEEKSKKKKLRNKEKKDKEAREKKKKEKIKNEKSKDDDSSEVIENCGASATGADPMESGVIEEVQREEVAVVRNEKIGSTVGVAEIGVSEKNIQKEKEEKSLDKGKEEKKEPEQESRGRKEEEKKKKEWKEKEAKEKKEREEREEMKEREREGKKERERKEREMKLKKEKERDKDRRENEAKEREQREKLRREKDKDKREKMERDKERREKERKERSEKKEIDKQEKEEKREREKREKEECVKEKLERDGTNPGILQKKEGAAEPKSKDGKTLTPTRPAPLPPPRGKKWKPQAAAEPSTSSAQATHASKDAPLTETSASSDTVSSAGTKDITTDEGGAGKEVVNTSNYRLDTESDNREEVQGRKGLPWKAVDSHEAESTAADRFEEVDDALELSIRNISSDMKSFITNQHMTDTIINTSSMKSPTSTEPIPDNVANIQDEIRQGMSLFQTTATLPGPSCNESGMLDAEESRDQRKVEAEEASNSEYYVDTAQLGFSDISAWEDEMCNFSEEEEDLDHTYIKSNSPCLDQANLERNTKDNKGLLLVAEGRDDTVITQASVSQEEYGGSHAAQKMAGVGEGVIDVGVKFSSGRGEEKMPLHSMAVGRSGVPMSDVDGQGIASIQSTGTQAGAGYSSPFEESVMNILKSMGDKMLQMKSNPMVLQREIHEQEQLQKNMIQKMISMSLGDPDVMKTLLTMLNKQNTEKAPALNESMVFDELQSKLLLANEEQKKASKVQLQTQVDFQEAIQKKLDEQTMQHEMGLHKYAKTMEEHWMEYEKKWEEFENRNRQKKEEEEKKTKEKNKNRRHGKHRRNNKSHDSSSSDSDEELVWVSSASPKPKPKIVNFSGIKTMQAKIIQQELLSSDDLMTNSQISVEKIKEKQEARGKLLRKNTVKKLDDTQQAMLRFESEQKGDGEDDDELLQFQHVHPITLKRAQIKVQDGSGYTRTHSQKETSKGKVGRIMRIESGGEQPDVDHGHRMKQQPDKEREGRSVR